MENSDDYLLISGIQHFVFCRRQWALIHIEGQWKENFLTVEGEIGHENVHNGNRLESRGETLTVRGMRIKSDRYHITGTCDAVEFIKTDEGITLNGREGLWRVRPVEYKHGESKSDDCDRLQLAAQVLCLEEMMSCEIRTADIYYMKTRRREVVTIDDDLRELLDKTVTEMYDLFRRGHTPKVKTTSKCRACSLADICLPKLLKKCDRQSVESYVQCHVKEEGAL